MDEHLPGSLPERRRVAEAVRALGRTRNEAELMDAVQAIVAGFPPEMVISALLAELGADSSQLRGGLARLAALLPHAETAAALREFAANRSKDKAARATALLILGRWMHESAPPGLVAELQLSQDAAMASLMEAIDEGRSNRHVLLEYVEQMQQNSVDIAFAVLDALDDLPADDKVELLRLIAQDARVIVARSALQRLESLVAGGTASAAAALHTLRFTLRADLAAMADRALRKLQMRGQPYTPPPATGLRALMGGPDMDGLFSLWFVGVQEDDPEEDPTGWLIGLAVHLRFGILECRLVEEIESSAPQTTDLPGDALVAVARSIVGHHLIEIGLDDGRSLLRRALSAYWREPDREPLPRDYVLNNDLLWQYAAPAASVAVSETLDGALSSLPLSADEAVEATDRLMRHPSMAHWHYALGENGGRELKRLARKYQWSRDESASALLQVVDEQETRDAVVADLAAALRLQALWLAWQGETSLSRDALALAEMTSRVAPSANPLLERIAAKTIAALWRK